MAYEPHRSYRAIFVHNAQAMGSKQLGDMQTGFFIQPVGGEKLNDCVLGPVGTVVQNGSVDVASATIVFDEQGRTTITPDVNERRTSFLREAKSDGYDGRAVGVWKLEL